LRQEGFSIGLLINGGCKFPNAEFLENILWNLPDPLLYPRTICPFSVLKNWVTVTAEHPCLSGTMLSHGKYIDFCKT
jgi:hypothetical protein